MQEASRKSSEIAMKVMETRKASSFNTAQRSKTNKPKAQTLV